MASISKKTTIRHLSTEVLALPIFLWCLFDIVQFPFFVVTIACGACHGVNTIQTILMPKNAGGEWDSL
jgi:carbon starvation protein CstA